jgi:hypothetical protein
MRNVIEMKPHDQYGFAMCPFCRKLGTARVMGALIEKDYFYGVLCYPAQGGCEASTGLYSTMEEAITIWNLALEVNTVKAALAWVRNKIEDGIDLTEKNRILKVLDITIRDYHPNAKEMEMFRRLFLERQIYD